MNAAEIDARLKAAKYIIPQGYEIIESARVKEFNISTRTTMREVEDRSDVRDFKDWMRGTHAKAISTQLADLFEPKYVGQDMGGALLWETTIKVVI